MCNSSKITLFWYNWSADRGKRPLLCIHRACQTRNLHSDVCRHQERPADSYQHHIIFSLPPLYLVWSLGSVLVTLLLHVEDSSLVVVVYGVGVLVQPGLVRVLWRGRGGGLSRLISTLTSQLETHLLMYIAGDHLVNKVGGGGERMVVAAVEGGVWQTDRSGQFIKLLLTWAQDNQDLHWLKWKWIL